MTLAHDPTRIDLAQWLSRIEQLHPKNIDMGLARVRTVAQRMALGFSCPVITVAGTNGKGSTCAMLDAIYTQAGYKTGVYSSPHLVHFEERCRLMGEPVAAGVLVAAFERVEAARLAEPQVSLSYFEYTTLSMLDIMSKSDLDVAILEVGLGGRLDAVNLIDTDCAIITSIDIDHVEYLGPDRESIGFEKAGIMRAGKPAIVGDPMPPDSIIKHAKTIGADLWRMGVDFNFNGDKQQWGWAGRDAGAAAATDSAAPSARRYSGLAYPALRGANQILNASGVLAAITALRERLPVTAQAVRNGFAFVELPGRFQIVPGQPALVLDVAHNPHSVAALTANLDAMGFYPVTHAVFGAMGDKDLPTMLAKIAPLVDKWYLSDLPTARAASAQALQERLVPLLKKGQTATCHANPLAALDAAVAAAASADRIVVFGSFYTVGGVLANGTPRLDAKHLHAELPSSLGQTMVAQHTDEAHKH
jgi:dihydrofolate synthase / folylpolyglutamate synthase